jgi:hypothetical protein
VATVELLDNKIRLTQEATLEDIHNATDEWRLPVEPLSKRIAIADFLLAGGYGYGSFTEGSLASKILNLSWMKGGRSYHYGLPDSTLYNAGYPLQRIVDMGRSRLLDMELGRIESLTLLAVRTSIPRLFFDKQKVEEIAIPADAREAVFLNEKAASLLGLHGAGLLTASSGSTAGGEDAGDAWQKRFIEDSLPRGLSTTRVLTVNSNVEGLVDAAGMESYVIALATPKGFVVNIYCTSEIRETLSQKVESLKHCYLL